VVACGSSSPGASDEVTARTAEQLVSTVGTSVEQCKVATRTGSADPLACGGDLAAADLGVSVYDGATTWVLFGDSQVADSNPTTSPAWRGDADATGWFGGTSPVEGLCGGLTLADLANATSGLACSSGTEVFAPDVVFGPSAWGESIGDFVFVDSVVRPPTAPALPANAAVPGTSEVPTGAFSIGRTIYTFTTGAPWIGASTQQPVPSVSYLTAWTAASPVYEPFSANTQRVVISKVDFNLQNVSYPPGRPNPPYPTPAAPPGWQASPPLGGHFVQVSPVLTGGYLYLFGTGEYRASAVYLARIPVSGASPGVSEYFVDTPGFQVWTASGWSVAGQGRSSVGSAAPLAFPDAPPANVGELSVQYFAQGTWAMMYTPKGSLQVLARFASAPNGPWTAPSVVLDTSTSASESTYCCQGVPATGTDSAGYPLWQCQGAQILECGTSATVPVGTPRTGAYAPFMLPYLTPVSGSTYAIDYLLSTSEPYGDVLMSFDVTLAGCPSGEKACTACSFGRGCVTSCIPSGSFCVP
jgi:hypothetical protein